MTKHQGDTPYTLIEDVMQTIQEIQADSIISRTVVSAQGVKTILFGFAPGQELSEHTASKPAILHFLRGQAQLTLGEDSMNAAEGMLVHMPAHLSHSIYAETDVLMLL